MSGGSFDYACYRTMQFADELRNKLQEYRASGDFNETPA